MPVDPLPTSTNSQGWNLCSISLVASGWFWRQLKTFSEHQVWVHRYKRLDAGGGDRRSGRFIHAIRNRSVHQTQFHALTPQKHAVEPRKRTWLLHRTKEDHEVLPNPRVMTADRQVSQCVKAENVGFPFFPMSLPLHRRSWNQISFVFTCMLCH